MNISWWKLGTAVPIIYALVAGLMGTVPRLVVLNETIRNLYYHVGMWFSMLALWTGSLVFSIRYLSKPDPISDLKREQGGFHRFLHGHTRLIDWNALGPIHLGQVLDQ